MRDCCLFVSVEVEHECDELTWLAENQRGRLRNEAA